MTRKDVAELKGELFGLQVLVMQSLCFIAAHTENPVRHLNGLRDAAIAGISGEPKTDIPPRHLQVFQQAAADVVLHCVEAAQAVFPEAVVATDRARSGRQDQPAGGLDLEGASVTSRTRQPKRTER